MHIYIKTGEKKEEDKNIDVQEIKPMKNKPHANEHTHARAHTRMHAHCTYT